MHAEKNLKSHRLRKAGMLQLAAMAAVLAFAIPGRAGDGRAVKSRVAPVYPELAKRMKIIGVVKIEATVDAEGKVVDVKTLSGSRTLSLAAGCSAEMEVRSRRWTDNGERGR